MKTKRSAGRLERHCHPGQQIAAGVDNHTAGLADAGGVDPGCGAAGDFCDGVSGLIADEDVSRSVGGNAPWLLPAGGRGSGNERRAGGVGVCRGVIRHLVDFARAPGSNPYIAAGVYGDVSQAVHNPRATVAAGRGRQRHGGAVDSRTGALHTRRRSKPSGPAWPR